MGSNMGEHFIILILFSKMASQMFPHKTSQRYLISDRMVRAFPWFTPKRQRWEWTQYDSFRETVVKNSLSEIIFQDL